ncbi:MAG: ABC-type dipeptide transport system, periplasmic component, partial [uncultured Rubrobacteraceae bacterium]
GRSSLAADHDGSGGPRAGGHRGHRGPEPAQLVLHHVEHDGGAGPHRRAGPYRGRGDGRL